MLIHPDNEETPILLQIHLQRNNTLTKAWKYAVFFSMSKILHPAAFHVCWCSPFDPLAALLSKHSQMILISLDAECRCHPRVGMLVDRPLLNDLKHIVNTGKHLCLCNNCDAFFFCKGVFSEYVPFFL